MPLLITEWPPLLRTPQQILLILSSGPDNPTELLILVEDLIHGSFGLRESAPKPHLDRFSRFCRVQQRDQQIDRQANRQTDRHSDAASRLVIKLCFVRLTTDVTGCDNVNAFPARTVEVLLGQRLHLFCDAKQSTASVRWSKTTSSTTV